MSSLRAFSVVLLAALVALPTMAAAEGPEFLDFGKPTRDSGGESGVRTPVYYSWMHPEVSLAWRNDYLGQGATITVVDDFSSNSKYFGNLGDGLQRLRHGEWTNKEAGMIATSATMVSRDYRTSSDRAVSLNTTGLDVLNLSYGYVGHKDEVVAYDTLQASIIAAARDAGAVSGAFASKAAGNDSGTEVGQPNSSNNLDFLARDLIGAQGAIFVGALDRNGSTDSPASMASYSNVAGNDPFVVNGQTYYVRDQFLVVGVESGTTGLAGTSFAAPVVSAYAGMLARKFADNNPSPAVVADQLLNTARTDTIAQYNRDIHGMGEASIANALAPLAIK